MDNIDNNQRFEGNVDHMNDNIDKSDTNVETQPTHNESQLSSTSATSWWGNWIQSAKDKSCEAYEFLKRDLNELKETVQNDTAVVVSNTASYVRETISDTITGISNTVAPLYDEDVEEDNDHNIDSSECIVNKDIDNKPIDNSNDNNKSVTESEKAFDNKADEEGDQSHDWTINLTNRAKHKLNTLIGNIADAFVINRNYFEDEDEMYVISGDKVVAVDRWKTILTEIQTDPKTYCREPSGPPEHYESWLMTFNLIDYQRQMDYLLQNVPEIKQFYCQLVPNSLSDVEFWHRYYYKIHQMREMERKRIIDHKQSLTKEAKDESSGVTSDVNPNKSVEVKLLQESSQSFATNDLKEELAAIASNECSVSDKEDWTPSPQSIDTRQSETSSDDWEKTDINEMADESTVINTKTYASDEDIKDWVKYE